MRLLFTPGVRVALVSADPSPATLALAAARVHGVDLVPMRPVEALERLHGGDVAVGRLDVRPTLDGVEDGLWTLGVLAARGVTVLNPAGALLAAHDKLLTARLLRRAAVPHPRTWSVRGDRPAPSVEPPAVVKPRHGSWGRSVALCTTRAALDEELDRDPPRDVVPRARRDPPGARATRRTRPAARRRGTSGRRRRTACRRRRRVAHERRAGRGAGRGHTAACRDRAGARRDAGARDRARGCRPSADRRGLRRARGQRRGRVHARTIGRAATSSTRPRWRSGSRRGLPFRTPAPTSTRSTAI